MSVRPRGQNRSRGAFAAKTKQSLKSTLIVGLAVPGLFATAALPAYALSSDGTVANATANIAGTATAQSLSVSADAAPAELARDTYATSNASDARAAVAAGAESSSTSGSALESFLDESDDGWWRPVPGPVTSPFGPRALICNAAGCSNPMHEGIDFGDSCGTPIRAAAGGTVTFVGNAGGYGNRVIIAHDGENGQSLETIYGHVLDGSYGVQLGDEVSGGQIIAEVGATGVVSGCHLDLKIMVDGTATDPDVFLTNRGVNV